jgi:hypothetical protein
MCCSSLLFHTIRAKYIFCFTLILLSKTTRCDRLRYKLVNETLGRQKSMPLILIYYITEYCTVTTRYDMVTNHTTITIIHLKKAVSNPWKEHIHKIIDGRITKMIRLSEYISLVYFKRKERNILLHTPTGSTWRLVWKWYRNCKRVIFWNVFNEKLDGGYAAAWVWHYGLLVTFVARKRNEYVTFSSMRVISWPDHQKYYYHHIVWLRWVDKRCFVFTFAKSYHRPSYVMFIYCLDWYNRNNRRLRATVLQSLGPIGGYYPYKLSIYKMPIWVLILYHGTSDYIRFEGFDLAKKAERWIIQAIIREANKILKQLEVCVARKATLFTVRSQSTDAIRRHWHFQLLFYQARQKCRISDKIFPKDPHRIEFTCQYPVHVVNTRYTEQICYIIRMYTKTIGEDRCFFFEIANSNRVISTVKRG